MMLQNTHNRNKSTRTKLFVAQANKKRMEKNKRKPNRTFAIVRTKCFNQLHIAIQSIRFYCCTHAKWNEGSNEDINADAMGCQCEMRYYVKHASFIMSELFI